MLLIRRVSDHTARVVTNPANEMTGHQVRYGKTKDDCNYVQPLPAATEEAVYEEMF